MPWAMAGARPQVREDCSPSAGSLPHSAGRWEARWPGQLPGSFLHVRLGRGQGGLSAM